MCELISIIVPVYNAKNFLDKCLNSLVNQSYEQIEIIVVDDGSTDGSDVICQQYAKRHKNIHYIPVINGGVSSARNIGLDHANGKYVGFVDADDYVSDKMFEELYKLITLNEMYDLSVCEVYQRLNKDISVLIPDQAIYNLFNVNSFGGFVCNKLFKKDIINSLNLRFSEDIFVCEDALFCYKYCQKARSVIYQPKQLYFYINHVDSAFNKEFNTKQLSVIQAFNQILHHNPYSRTTISMIESNYVLILLKLCVKALKSINKEDINYYNMLRVNIEQYFKVFLKNPNISFKYKLYSVIIMYFPQIVRLTK